MKGLKGALMFAQSGGPTSVINASAAGVFIEALAQKDAITAVYGAAHGIRGVLEEDFYDMSKEDIKELTSFFKDMMESRTTESTDHFINDFERNYSAQPGIQGIYRILIKNYKKPLIIRVQNHKCECFYGTSEYADVEIQLEEDILKDIVDGKTSFQRSFMGGDMTMKGDFKIMRSLDRIFPFAGADEMTEEL